MNYLSAFQAYLEAQTPTPSHATLKNYMADIRQVISWVEVTEHRSFYPELLTPSLLSKYQQDKNLAAASCERQASTLRKFYAFLQKNGYTSYSPVTKMTQEKNMTDPFHLRSFKNALYLTNRSHLTTKNYIVDVQQFLSWMQQVIPEPPTWEKKEDVIFSSLSTSMLKEYKDRLEHAGNYSPATVNRKLSSLRKYLGWCTKKGLTTHADLVLESVENITKSPKQYKNISIPETLIPDSIPETVTYSRFPPLRVCQKLLHVSFLLFDRGIVLPLAHIRNGWKTLVWRFNGRPLFTNPRDQTVQRKKTPDSFYAPISSSLSLNRKCIYFLFLKRPKWYKSYRSYAISTYVHFLMLFFFLGVIGLSGYHAFLGKTATNHPSFALAFEGGRLLSFKGKLTDPDGLPLQGQNPVRFALYNNKTASGSALVWQEVNQVFPDQDGIFAITLGNTTPLTEQVFTGNTALWIGITVGSGNELSPRQQIPTIDYASNADSVQGLVPITHGTETKNVLLALDSRGNLTIGDGSPTFQATAGDFTLLGQTLIFGTNPGSNGNVVIEPDGFGTINLQKPIQNTSNNNNIPTALGSVEIDDTFAILATSSSQSAFTINQNGFGDLISASVSGIAKFTLKNDGSGYFAGNVGIGIPDPQVSLAINGNLSLENTGRQLFSYNPSTLQIGGGRTGSESGNIVFGNGQGWKFAVGKASDNGVTKFLTIQDNGYIGIGTNDPASIFHVSGYTANASSLAILNQTGLGDIFTASQGGNTKFVLSNAGNLGIGTVAPASKLHIVDGQNTSSVATFENRASLSGNKPVGISLRLGTDGTNPTTDSHYVNFLRGDGTLVGKIQGNGSGGISYSTDGSDLAEYFKKEDRFEPMYPGDLVCHGQTGVTRCTVSHAGIIGVVSNQAGFIGGTNHESDPSFVLVGLIGQLPVNLVPGTTITASDPITVSSIPGLAVKATSASQIVGRALSGNIRNAIAVAVQPMYFDPQISLDDTGNLTLESIDQTGSNQSAAPRFNLVEVSGSVISHVGAFSDAVFANARAGFLAIEHATIKSAYILTAEIALLRADHIISPLAEVNHLQTDFISPLAKDSHIGVGLTDSALTIHADTASTSAVVASIDNQGNARLAGDLEARQARFAGQVTSSSFQTTDATISGVLHTRKLIADEIVGPAIYNSISTATASGTVQTPPSDGPYIPIASLSGSLAYVEDLHAKTARFEEGLLSFGSTSLSDTAIAGTLSIGSTFSLSGNAINVLGGDLQLQPLQQGGVSIAGGKVYFDNDGNLAINGNATIQGTLAAGIIAPIPGKNLVFQLGTNTNEKTSLEVKNASNSGVFAINQAGDVSASGSAYLTGDIYAQNGIFTKLNFQIVKPAFALSDTEIAASGSAGIATINAHQKELTIRNNQVTDKSLIYITPKGDTQNIVLYLMRQVPNESFTVGINTPVGLPIPFNWLIVN